MSASTTIERALEMMEEKGWMQDHPGDETVGYCIAGALYQAATDESPWEENGRHLFREALLPVQAQIGPNVAHWNDEADRTFSQVREVMKRAAYEVGAPVTV